MARSHTRLYTSIWRDKDFLRLSVAAQRAYMMLISQPGLGHAGVLSTTVRRWSILAADASQDDIRAALAELDHERFIVVDEDTEELLIRTMIRNDGVYKQPKVLAAAIGEAAEVASEAIRATIAQELSRIRIADLPDSTRGTVEALLKDLPDPLAEVAPHGGVQGGADGGPEGGPHPPNDPPKGGGEQGGSDPRTSGAGHAPPEQEEQDSPSPSEPLEQGGTEGGPQGGAEGVRVRAGASPSPSPSSLSPSGAPSNVSPLRPTASRERDETTTENRDARLHRILVDNTDATPDEAPALWDAIRTTHTIKTPVAWLRECAANDDLQDLVTTARTAEPETRPRDREKCPEHRLPTPCDACAADRKAEDR